MVGLPLARRRGRPRGAHRGPDGFATQLAAFLVALQRIDAGGGPAPGRHNFFRGGPLATYADETVRSIDALGGEIRGAAASRVWEDAMAAAWEGDPVWFHGDVATGNLLCARAGWRR